jgi:hypothetical protein
MPFTLIPPGTRKGNPYYLVRGTMDGREREVSTKTRDKAAARQFAKDLERELLASGPPKPGELVSFEKAARLYAEFRGLDLDVAQHPDAKRINRLIAELGPSCWRTSTTRGWSPQPTSCARIWLPQRRTVRLCGWPQRSCTTRLKTN